MKVTIETFFCPYCDEATEIYLRLVNTILFADDENSLRKGIEKLKPKCRSTTISCTVSVRIICGCINARPATGQSISSAD